MQIHAERNTIIKDRDRKESYSSFTHEAIIRLMIASSVKLEELSVRSLSLIIVIRFLDC